jgi:hypothetical protein
VSQSIKLKWADTFENDKLKKKIQKNMCSQQQKSTINLTNKIDESRKKVVGRYCFLKLGRFVLGGLLLMEQ